MATNNRPRNSADAKAKSRQQSRPVNAGKRPATAKSGSKGRSRSTLFTWGAVAIVVVVVVVLVVVKVTGSKSTGTAAKGGGTSVSAAVLSEIEHVPASVFNKVGDGSSVGVNPPKYSATNPALTFTTKPGFFYDGAEFCPYCAAERWSMVIALSRFGTFNGLQNWFSSSTDSYPNTPTFTFTHATYTSQYLIAKLVESENETHQPLQKPTKQEQALIAKYDGTTNTHPIPFMDIGGKVIVSGSSYSPTVLEGLTHTQIAADLSDATNPVTQAIIGTANYLSAAICSMDTSAPSSVCASSGVKAAAKSLGITA